MLLAAIEGRAFCGIAAVVVVLSCPAISTFETLCRSVDGTMRSLPRVLPSLQTSVAVSPSSQPSGLIDPITPDQRLSRLLRVNRTFTSPARPAGCHHANRVLVVTTPPFASLAAACRPDDFLASGDSDMFLFCMVTERGWVAHDPSHAMVPMDQVMLVISQLLPQQRAQTMDMLGGLWRKLAETRQGMSRKGTC